MSIQFPSENDVELATDHLEVPDDPDEVFDELVADPGRCCQQCYRRLRSRQRFPDEAGYQHGDLIAFLEVVLPEGTRWELLETEYFERELLEPRSETVYPPDGTNESERACRACGAIEPHRSPSTRSRQATLEAATGISATLTELSVAHNPLALLVEVADLKRDPDMAGDDHATFATATARAVRAGRTPTRLDA